MLRGRMSPAHQVHVIAESSQAVPNRLRRASRIWKPLLLEGRLISRDGRLHVLAVLSQLLLERRIARHQSVIALLRLLEKCGVRAAPAAAVRAREAGRPRRALRSAAA